MNDPGLDEPISRNVEVAENEAKPDDAPNQDEMDGMEDEQAYLTPSRWWFASTAFPLIAGTFGPMANAFNICALASNWRVKVAPGQSEDNGDVVPDPKWLIGINAVSVILALIANFALLFNMARRIPFTIAQPVTIVGWYISSFILIGLVIAATHAPSFQLPLEENPALTQAFYYAIMAAALYMIISTMMVVTVWGAYKGHYSKDFKLTMSQRTLMLQTIAYLVYLLAGAAVFARIEDWLFLNGVYWANFTLLTIGVGDFYPKTHTGQALLFPFAIGGIVILGLVIGSIRSMVLERGKKKLGARMVEKKREKVIKELDDHDGKVNLSPLTKPFSKGQEVISDDKPEIQRRKQEFELMRKLQQMSHTKRKWMALMISGTAWLALWLIGAMVFWFAERGQQQWTYFESIYFAYVSLLTIGYGDYYPVSNAAKPFFVFWSLLAVPTLTILISNMGDTVIKSIRDLTIYLGEFTVLPGEGSAKDRLKEGTRRIKEGKVFGKGENPTEEPPGGAFMPESDRKEDEDPEKGKRTEALVDKVADQYEEEELEEMKDAKSKGDVLQENEHLYHFLLVKEIRRVMKDLNEEPPKKYAYHEWAWFLRLLGEDENDKTYHLKSPAKADPKEEGMPGQSSLEKNKTKSPEDLQWSWVSSRSPLMGDIEEPEWVLERLLMKLEELLKAVKERKRKERKDTNGGEDSAESSPTDQEFGGSSEGSPDRLLKESQTINKNS